jgi:O-antigen/teichoic acid export membrane protein
VPTMSTGCWPEPGLNRPATPKALLNVEEHSMTENKPRSFSHALKWAYTANWGEKAFSSLFMFILAAMLGPRDFGVVSLAMIYILFIQMVQTQGFLTALVQHAHLEREHLDTIFWTNAVLAVVFTVVSILFGGFWAKLNHLPDLYNYIAVLSLCIPLQGLAIVQTALLQREMDFQSLSLRTNLSVIIGGLVGLAVAWSGKGVWALIVQQITRDFVALVLLWQLTRWRPRLGFSVSHLRDLLRFSFSNFTAQLAIFADAQGGAILMGTLFGPVTVGLYRVAERVVSSVSAVATSSIQTVSLPEFSRHQDNPAALRKSVLTCVRMSAVLTLPAMAGLLTISHSFMGMLGAKWYPATDVLKLLSLLGMFVMFSMFTGPLLQAMGRPNALAILEWSRTLVGILLLALVAWLVRSSAVEMQVTGIALVRCVSGILLVCPVYFYLLLRFGRVSLREVAHAVMPSILSSLAIFGSSLLLRFSGLVTNLSPAFTLSAQILVGGLSGSVTYFAFDANARYVVSNFLRNCMKSPLFSKDTV